MVRFVSFSGLMSRLPPPHTRSSLFVFVVFVVALVVDRVLLTFLPLFTLLLVLLGFGSVFVLLCLIIRSPHHPPLSFTNPSYSISEMSKIK